jgi:hypothetical protein
MTVALISARLCVGSSGERVMHLSALSPCAARFLEASGLSATTTDFRP